MAWPNAVFSRLNICLILPWQFPGILEPDTEYASSRGTSFRSLTSYNSFRSCRTYKVGINGSETFLWPGLWVGWSVGRSVIISKKGESITKCSYRSTSLRVSLYNKVNFMDSKDRLGVSLFPINEAKIKRRFQVRLFLIFFNSCGLRIDLQNVNYSLF